MSHRKRVRAYWNWIAREKRRAELLADFAKMLKAIYPRAQYPRELVYRGAPLRGVGR